MEFREIDSREQAQGKLWEHYGKRGLRTEHCSLGASIGRAAGEDIRALLPIPAFARSVMDGYAVISGDTAAAGEALPAMRAVRGEVYIGQDTDLTLSRGECAYIPTGGMLPAGADAVVMAEYCESYGRDGLLVYRPAAPGEHVVQPGDDIREGERLIPRGRILRPADIGALAAAGAAAVPVYVPPRLTILSTGDELAVPGEALERGQVYDINTYALRALAESRGFNVIRTETLPDGGAYLERAVRAAMRDSDIVAVSGGSSRGKADLTGEVLERVSSPGLFTAGIAVKPGKPTLFAWDEASGTLLAGLPGHPVSALLVFETFLCGLLRQMTGTEPPLPIPASLTEPVPSSPGKYTLCPVRLTRQDGGFAAHPVWGKSGLITTLSAADGYIEIAAGAEGLPPGSAVCVQVL